MKILTRRNIISAVVVLALGLPAAPGSAGDRQQEKLLETQKRLGRRIEALRREQDFLVFEKTVCAQDSKYLVLNIEGRKGQLRYKNRVLRDFPALPESRNLQRLKQQALPLTGKVEGPRRKNAMLFGDSLVVLAKGGDPGPHAKLPRLVLSRRDFRALYYALENGAFLYVLR